MASHWECEACGGRLIMALVAGRRELLDWARDDQGDHAAYQTVAGAWIARPLGQDALLRPAEHRYTRHYDASPRCRPPAPEQRAAAAAVSDFLGEYRAAQAARGRAARNRRGRRQAPITGIRIQPGRQP